MQYQTNIDEKYAHPNFYFSIDEELIPKDDALWLKEHLESEVASGVIFSNNETIQMGSVEMKVSQRSDGDFTLTEPDMTSVPIKFIDSVTSTLNIFRQQKDTVESLELNLEASYPSLREGLIVSKSFHEANNYFFAREGSEDNMSGWFLKDLSINDNDDEFEVISLYELYIKKPELMKFCAFPPSVTVLKRTNDIIRVIKDEQELSIKHNSFLSQINQQFSL